MIFTTSFGDSVQWGVLDLESLRCFEAAAGAPSFREAADRVHLSPAAFGARIQALERELGAALFTRTTRSVRLTAAGERLVPHARRLLGEARRLAETIATPDAEAPYELTIGTRFELGLSWLEPTLDALERQFPSRRHHLAFGAGDDLIVAVLERRVDAAVTSTRLTAAGLHSARLHEERYTFVASPALLAERPLSEPEHAAAHELIDVARDLPLFRYFLEARPAEEVWGFGGIRQLGSIGAAKARVLRGGGVAVLPAYFVAEELASGALAVVASAESLHRDAFRLVWRADHPEPERLRRLALHLSETPLR